MSQSAAGTHNRLQTDGTFNYTCTEFIYDAFNQRVGKRLDTGTIGSWDRYEAYIWADGQEVLRFVDSDGQGAAQPFRLSNRYLWGDVVDQLLADEQYATGTGPDVNATVANTTAGSTLWALTDHLGSVRDLVDNSGIIREHNVYDSFGRLIREVDYNTAGAVIASTSAAAIDTIFGYTARDFDADVGLQNNRARWYDPATGRWLSQDPIGFGGGDANLYRNVGNHPTYARDPSGLQEPKPKSAEEAGAFDEFPELPGQGLPVKPVKPKSLEDSMNVSIDEFLIRLISMSDSSDSVVCKYGQGTNIADQLWKSKLMKVFREWFETGADTYPIDKIKQNYDSGIKEVQYVAPAKDFYVMASFTTLDLVMRQLNTWVVSRSSIKQRLTAKEGKLEFGFVHTTHGLSSR